MLESLTRQMLYPVPPFRVPEAPAPLEEVRLEVERTEVIAWAWNGPSAVPVGEPKGGSAPQVAPAVVFFHGNGENLGTMEYSGLFKDLFLLEVPFLAVDYPGYGRSGGRPSQESLVASAEAGLAWLAERHPERPMALVGWSLGAAVAVQAASRQSARRPGVDRLVLMSAWADLPNLASLHFPGWLVRAGLRDTYDSMAAAERLEIPVLMLHGTDDRIIPIEHGRRLAAALGDRVRFVEVPRTGHNDLLGRSVVWEQLAAFLEPRVPDDPPGGEAS